MNQPRFPVLWFFFLTYALTVVGQGVHLYVVHRLSAANAGMPINESPVGAWMPYGFYITNAGPSLVGLLMTLYMYGLQGVRRIAVQLAPWSVGRAWPVLAVCLFLPLLIVLIPSTILATGDMSDSSSSWQLSTYVYGSIISGGLIGPGMCEEIGWRGFAQPHLQRRHSAFVSSLIIGVAWAVWHWPNYFIASNPHPYWAFVALIPMGISASIIYTWAYNSTGGSLFAVVVLHGATVAVPSMSDSPGFTATVIAPLLYPIIAIGLVSRYGAANLSWRENVYPRAKEQT